MIFGVLLIVVKVLKDVKVGNLLNLVWVCIGVVEGLSCFILFYSLWFLLMLFRFFINFYFVIFRCKFLSLNFWC